MCILLHPSPTRTLFERSLTLYMIHDEFFSISLKFRRHNMYIYIQTYVYIYYYSFPSHTLISRKNLVDTAYSTDDYLVCETIAQQGAIFDKIISKQALNIHQFIQINV